MSPISWGAKTQTNNSYNHKDLHQDGSYCNILEVLTHGNLRVQYTKCHSTLENSDHRTTSQKICILKKAIPQKYHDHKGLGFIHQHAMISVDKALFLQWVGGWHSQGPMTSQDHIPSHPACHFPMFCHSSMADRMDSHLLRVFSNLDGAGKWWWNTKVGKNRGTTITLWS